MHRTLSCALGGRLFKKARDRKSDLARRDTNIELGIEFNIPPRDGNASESTPLTNRRPLSPKNSNTTEHSLNGDDPGSKTQAFNVSIFPIEFPTKLSNIIAKLPEMPGIIFPSE